MPNRPAKRVLVRWNDDHDKELLLWIVYCCTEQGMKLPWPRIAQCMGADFSEGACVQHLAKVRNKMDEAGFHVPPTQKRGTVTKTGSSLYGTKPKPITAPPPRIRPDIPPPGRDYGMYDDEEEEEEIEEPEHLIFGNAPRRGIARNTRRQACNKSTVPTAHDFDEDDSMPPLFDSDNEPGAGKSNSLSNRRNSLHGGKMKLTFGGKSVTPFNPNDNPMARDLNNEELECTAPQPSHSSPKLKYESRDDLPGDNSTAPRPPPVAAPTRGRRRRSSALFIQDDDDDEDEYEPPTRGKGRPKKNKAGRPAKKQKTDDSNKQKSGAESGKKEVGHDVAAEDDALGYYDHDRAAMPPPALPPSNAHNYVGMGWRNTFMNDANAGGTHYNDGSWNDYAPISDQLQNFPYAYADAGAYPGAGTQYAHLAHNMPQPMSAVTSRHPSFASATSTSTIETMPSAWNQPVRSPGFPNPREATRVLYSAINTPDANTSTQIDIFGQSSSGQNMLAPHNHSNSSTDSYRMSTDHPMSTVGDSSDNMFGNLPDAVGDDSSFFTDFLDDAGFH